MTAATGDALARDALCGEYVIERLLGRGGFGRVYLARHRVLGRAAAIKLLDRELASSPRVFRRFVWEARATCRVRHPGIVEVLDFGRLTDGRPFLVMELLDGETLEELVAGEGRVALPVAAAITEQLAAALAAVHAQGIVHRDVKPSNVFVCAPGDRVKLLDFGIAKLVRPDPDERSVVTTATTRLGTPEAMAPEQIRGLPIDGRTDVYGLGVTLYRMLTGAWPFAAEDPVELARLHLEAEPLPVGARVRVPAAVDEVVRRALGKSPSDRFADPLALAVALRAAAGSTSSRPTVRSTGMAAAAGTGEQRARR